jgi:hypothetical protein
MPVKPARDLDDLIREIDEAMSALEAARDELVAERAHADAGEVFVATLTEVLGDRTLPESVVRRAALTAAAGVAWENAVGPLLTASQARELLTVSRQRLDQLAKRGRLLVLTDSSSARLYPAWQFDEHGQPLRALVAAHRHLVEDGGMSPWSAASWCTQPHPELDHRSPREWAAAAENAERLQTVAARDAARFAQ